MRRDSTDGKALDSKLRDPRFEFSRRLYISLLPFPLMVCIKSVNYLYHQLTLFWYQ